MEKRRKLNVELIKFLIGSMLVVGVLMLLGSSLVNNRQYRKLYNDKALEIAKTVSDQVNGDFIEELCKEIDTEEFEQIQKEAVAADDEQPIIDWLKEKGMYQNYERINEYLHSIQADMNIEYLYIQMIQDHSSVYLFDPSSGYLTLGYKEELSERFDKLKGNERLEPTVSRTEFGWLSSAGEPVLSSDGEKCAVAFVQLGGTMGVVGGLIVGQAAVDAHLVSTIVVIVVALTAIATFSIPNELFTSAFRLMKFCLIILCAFWGLYGFFLGFLAIFIHLFYLENYGVPYAHPMVEERGRLSTAFQDFMVRYPLKRMKYRPEFTKEGARVRQKEDEDEK